MIEVRLKKDFGRFLLDVEFSSSTKGITVLAGPSGSGKTSIINMIAGLLEPDEGTISIDDTVLFDSKTKSDLPIQNRKCGYVFQDGRLFPHMNVQKNLFYGADKEGEIKSEEVIQLLGIEHLLKRMPARLSGGEKQRVAIGRALLMNPRILLMDEPLAALDSDRKEELLPYISGLPEKFNLPVFYVTHSRKEILTLSDQLIRLKEGKLESAGNPSGSFNGFGIYETGNEQVSVVEGQVKSYQKEYGVITLGFQGGSLFVLGAYQETGKRVRAAIKASDVSLSLKKPDDISTKNIFEGTITEITPSTNYSVLVHLDIGMPLTARVSAASSARLKLESGLAIYAMVKSASLSPA